LSLFKHKSAEELMVIYQDGSPEDAVLAFEELYRRYSDRVYQYCLKKLAVRVDAEDSL
jgi:DNA-directed RNA polymerase specialized sigma24 family protein